MMRLVKKKHYIKTTVTYLEMLAPPVPRKNNLLLEDCALLRADNPPVHFYRYLYERVGEKHFWVSRNKINDRDLIKTIHDPLVEIYILYQGGVPVGFSEIDFRKPKLGDIVFLGLMEEKIGQGLGGFLLNEMIKTAWAKDISRLIIETCTLDHPNALLLYQKYGFEVYARKVFEIDAGK